MTAQHFRGNSSSSALGCRASPSRSAELSHMENWGGEVCATIAAPQQQALTQPACVLCVTIIAVQKKAAAEAAGGRSACLSSWPSCKLAALLLKWHPRYWSTAAQVGPQRYGRVVWLRDCSNAALQAAHDCTRAQNPCWSCCQHICLVAGWVTKPGPACPVPQVAACMREGQPPAAYSPLDVYKFPALPDAGWLPLTHGQACSGSWHVWRWPPAGAGTQQMGRNNT